MNKWLSIIIGLLLFFIQQSCSVSTDKMMTESIENTEEAVTEEYYEDASIRDRNDEVVEFKDGDYRAKVTLNSLNNGYAEWTAAIAEEDRKALEKINDLIDYASIIADTSQPIQFREKAMELSLELFSDSAKIKVDDEAKLPEEFLEQSENIQLVNQLVTQIPTYTQLSKNSVSGGLLKYDYKENMSVVVAYSLHQKQKPFGSKMRQISVVLIDQITISKTN